MPIRSLIFIACDWSSKEDAALANELAKHLELLEGNGFRCWSENHIVAGQVRNAELNRHLDQADIVLLLTSVNFLANERCEQIVMRALELQQAGKACVIPVILRTCTWELSAFHDLAPCPAQGRPVDSYRQRDKAWTDVVRAIIHADPRTAAQQAMSEVAKASSYQSHPVGGSSLAMPESQPLQQTSRLATAIEPVPLFTWIQLSDIHFGHGSASHSADQKLVTSIVVDDIALQRKHIPTPDVILVTGDIAFSGDSKASRTSSAPGEYAAARDFLRAVGQSASVAPERIFVIPGNHDVQRTSASQRGLWRLLRNLRDGVDLIDECLADENERQLLIERFASYHDFAAQFAPGCLSATPQTDRLVIWTHRYVARHGLIVRLIGLNTALLSNDNGDRGKLRLGMGALAQTLLPRREAGELLLVLSHHPFRGGWLADQQQIDQWVRNHAHVHLSGHVHEAESEDTRTGSGGALVRVSAGATHGEQPTGHGYNFASIMAKRDGSLSLRVWPRLWSDKNKHFRADTANLPDHQIYAEHPLRLQLPALV